MVRRCYPQSAGNVSTNCWRLISRTPFTIWQGVGAGMSNMAVKSQELGKTCLKGDTNTVLRN
jgi:hypothetical protein